MTDELCEIKKRLNKKMGARFIDTIELHYSFFVEFDDLELLRRHGIITEEKFSISNEEDDNVYEIFVNNMDHFAEYAFRLVSNTMRNIERYEMIDSFYEKFPGTEERFHEDYKTYNRWFLE